MGAVSKITALYSCLTQDEHPVTLRQNEGLLVRNVVIFPAAGVATLHVNLAWAELPAL
jgi:hypothetical protein